MMWNLFWLRFYSFRTFRTSLPVLNPGLLHAVLQVRGFVAEEHVTGAGGGVAGRRVELPFDVAHWEEKHVVQTNTHMRFVSG